MTTEFVYALVPSLFSALVSLFAFLFSAWVRGQNKQATLELQLEMANNYVKKEGYDKDVNELKRMIEQLTTQVSDLRSIIDRRFGRRTEEKTA